MHLLDLNWNRISLLYVHNNHGHPDIYSDVNKHDLQKECARNTNLASIHRQEHLQPSKRAGNTRHVAVWCVKQTCCACDRSAHFRASPLTSERQSAKYSYITWWRLFVLGLARMTVSALSNLHGTKTLGTQATCMVVECIQVCAVSDILMSNYQQKIPRRVMEHILSHKTFVRHRARLTHGEEFKTQCVKIWNLAFDLVGMTRQAGLIVQFVYVRRLKCQMMGWCDSFVVSNTGGKTHTQHLHRKHPADTYAYGFKIVGWYHPELRREGLA